MAVEADEAYLPFFGAFGPAWGYAVIDQELVVVVAGAVQPEPALQDLLVTTFR